jgi:xanthine dehydrogenase accessory factor
MSHSPLHLAALAEQRNTPAVLATVVAVTGSTPARPGARMYIPFEGHPAGTIGGGEVERRVVEQVRRSFPAEPAQWSFDLHADEADPAQPLCSGTMTVFLEPLGRRAPLVIFGGGHCGMALSRLAADVGFHVTVYDERPDWAAAERHPGADATICAPYAEALTRVAWTPAHFAVIMTPGHACDEAVLELLLQRDLAYLGLMGSPSKIAELFARLRDRGADAARLYAVRAPIGLPIHSRTPAEIAVSISAQLVAVRNGGGE